MSKHAIGSLRKEVNIELGKASKKREKYSLLQYPEARSLKSTTTQPAVGGPKTFWEDQRAWRPKNLAAQRAEGTKVLRRQTTGGSKKYLTNRLGTKNYALMSLVEFVEIYALFGRTKRTKNLRWEDQRGF